MALQEQEKTYYVHELIRTELGIPDGKMDVYRFDINKEVPEKVPGISFNFIPTIHTKTSLAE